MTRLVFTFGWILLLLAAGSTGTSGTPDGSVRVLLGDDPAQCLSLESIFVEGDSYVLIDGRNNQGRVKYITGDGVIRSAVLSTMPLPDAASLPSDILPSPWGLDRVVPASDALWAIPAPWAGSVAERFDGQTGEFLERLPDPGLMVSGITVGPEGRIWAVGARLLLNLSGGNPDYLNMGGTLDHIDTAVGHPLGFVVLQQPEILLIETTGIIRWSLSLEEITEGFLSPFDIATGPDGTIAVSGVICDLSLPEDREEYFRLRDECFNRDDEEVLFGVEDALRSNLATGFMVVLISADGAVTDAIEVYSPPVACDVDEFGRAHVLSRDENGFAVSILDPRLDEGFEVFNLPYGTPAMVAPHRIDSGPDGSLYWDDIVPGESEGSWGIGRLPVMSSTGLFALGVSELAVNWVFMEPMGNFMRQATALSVGPGGELWVGFQDFSFDILDEPIPDIIEESDTPYTSSAMLINRDGSILIRKEASEITGRPGVASEFIVIGNATVAAWAGRSEDVPIGFLSNDGSWSPAIGLNLQGPITNARLGQTSTGLVGWFPGPASEGSATRWLEIEPDLAGSREITRLGAIGCRFLESDPNWDAIWLTIDDGEIFRLDSSNYRVTGIWDNRLLSGAPGHVLDDAAAIADGLAILDREHRALLLVTPDAFMVPTLASEEEVSRALSLIRTALNTFRNSYGSSPAASSSLLDDILSFNDREIVRRAFLGGRIYHYRPTETGYTFYAWPATSEQPVLVCDQSGTEIVY